MHGDFTGTGGKKNQCIQYTLKNVVGIWKGVQQPCQSTQWKTMLFSDPLDLVNPWTINDDNDNDDADNDDEDNDTEEDDDNDGSVIVYTPPHLSPILCPYILLPSPL